MLIIRLSLLLLTFLLAQLQGQRVGVQNPVYSIQTLAGAAPSVNGNPGAFLSPLDLGYSSGYFYVPEPNGNTLRKISLDGTMTTIGSGVLGISSDGPYSRFFQPYMVSSDVNGSVFLTTALNSVHRISSGGSAIFENWSYPSGGGTYIQDGYLGSSGLWYLPRLFSPNPTNQSLLYFADGFSSIPMIRVWNRATDYLSTAAGTFGSPGVQDGQGPGATKVSVTGGMCFDVTGTLWIVEYSSNLIRKLTTPDHVLTTLSLNTTLDGPSGCVANPTNGGIYFLNRGSCSLHTVDSLGNVSHIAGQCGSYQDGNSTVATLSFSGGVPASLIHANGSFYLLDSANMLIRRINPTTGDISTAAGILPSTLSVYADGFGTKARIGNDVPSMAVARSGNIVFADASSLTLRQLSPEGQVTTIAGTLGQSGSMDGLALNSTFEELSGVAIDANNTVYVSDSSNRAIRMFNPKNGELSLLCGIYGTSAIQDGDFDNATFYAPSYMAIDSNGIIFVVDGQTIRKVDTNSRKVATHVGTDGVSLVADGVGAGNSSFGSIKSIAINSNNDIYVLDGNLIRRVTPEGVVSTVFIPGNYTSSFSFGLITIDRNGDILATEISSPSHSVWRIGLNTYTISPVVQSSMSTYPFLLLDGPTTSVASGGFITSLLLDNDGNIVFSVLASGMHVIRKLGLTCNGLFNPNACGGESTGVCVNYDVCQCANGNGGPACLNAVCNGVANMSSTVCNGHGQCFTSGQCTCNAGWTGDDCELPECFGVPSNGADVCSSHGSCTAPDTCQCSTASLGSLELPAYGGAACNVSVCFGYLGNDNLVCSSHGSCSSPNECSCFSGYAGIICSEATEDAVSKATSFEKSKALLISATILLVYLLH